MIVLRTAMMHQRSKVGITVVLIVLAQAFSSPQVRSDSGSGVDRSESTLNGIMTKRDGTNLVKIDQSGKGAVLCALGIFELVRAVGSKCHKGQDSEFQNEIDRSINRIDQFIITNSVTPITQDEIVAKRAAGDHILYSHPGICVGDVARLYDSMRDGGAEGVRARTSDLLSIPREPVTNPCL
jgi:hypothetical protein